MQDKKLTELTEICDAERRKYRNEQDPYSPACVEIVRRAFQGDQDAWIEVSRMVERLLRGWSQELSNRARELGYEYFDDFSQITWMNFYRSAPKDDSLIKDDTLGAFFAYFRECAYSTISHMKRSLNRNRSKSFYADDEMEDEISGIPDSNRTDEQAENSITTKLILESVEELLHDRKERVVFIARWICNWKARHIFDRHRDLFSSKEEVFAIQQRVDRRLLKSEKLRRLLDDLSSSIRPQDKQDATPMDYDCSLDLSDLIDVVLGVASAEVRAAVERSPGCTAAVQRLSAELLPLRSVLQRAFCPRTETMVAYHEQRLDGTTALQVHAHVQGCQACQDELALFKAIDAVPLTLQRESLRARIEALFQAPLAQPQPLMGGGVYRTPQIQIDITTDKAPGQPRTWTLWGAVRTSEGLPLNVPVERVTLQPLDQSAAEYPAALEANGGFVISGLPAGGYRLAVLIPDEEIFIRRLVVGDVLDLDGEASEHDNR